LFSAAKISAFFENSNFYCTFFDETCKNLKKMSIFAACFGNHSLQDGYGDCVFYSKAEITEDDELLFTQELLPFLYPGNAYLIVVNEGKLLLQENGVTLTADATSTF
jgi:hypothetical protein